MIINTHPKAISYLLLSHTPHVHLTHILANSLAQLIVILMWPCHTPLPYTAHSMSSYQGHQLASIITTHAHELYTLRWVSCFVLISWSRACRSLETPRQERGRILVSSNQVVFIRAFVIGLQREYEVAKLHDRSIALGLLRVCWCCLFVFSWYIRVHHTVLLKVSSLVPRPFIVSPTNDLGMRLGQP